MADQSVRFTVDFTISADKLDAFERTAQAMIAQTAKEAGALQYDWFLSSDRKRCRLLEAYKDPGAVVAHLSGPVVRDLVPKLLEAGGIAAFEVYGDPGAKGAELLAGLRADIFRPWHALTRS